MKEILQINQDEKGKYNIYGPVDGGWGGTVCPLFYCTAFKKLNYAIKLHNPGLANAGKAHRAPPRQTGRRGGRTSSQPGAS